MIFDCAIYLAVTCIEFALSIAAIKRIKEFKTNQLPAQLRIQTTLLGKCRRYQRFYRMVFSLLHLHGIRAVAASPILPLDGFARGVSVAAVCRERLPSHN